MQMQREAVDAAMDLIKAAPAGAPYVATLFGIAVPSIVQFASLLYIVALLAHYIWKLWRKRG